MARKRNSAARAAGRALEIGLLAPAVASRRLLRLPTLAPWQAALEWNRWVLEKSAAFSLAGMALARASLEPVQALGAKTLAEVAEQTLEQVARTTHAAMAPVHRRVRRNARRRKG